MENDLRAQMSGVNLKGGRAALAEKENETEGETQGESVQKRSDHLEREFKLFISSPFRDMQAERVRLPPLHSPHPL